MKRYFKLLLIVSLSSWLVSCDEIFNVEIIGDGNLKTERRSTGVFTGIFLDTDIEVVISEGTARELIVEADSNLLQYVSTEINNGILEIGEKSNFSIVPRHSVKVFVKVPSGFSEIEVINGGVVRIDSMQISRLDVRVYGVSQFITDSLNCPDFHLLTEGSTLTKITGIFENFTIYQKGSGNTLLKGEADNGEVVLEGSGKIDAIDLLMKDADLRLYGSGLIFCRVSGVLRTLIEGMGRIYYYGMPGELSKDVSGGGLVLPGEN